MACNCKSDLNEKLLERFKSKNPQAERHQVYLDGYAYVLTDTGVREVGYMPIESEALHPTKSGGRKLKKERGQMHFNFCPFCGVRYKEEGPSHE